MEKITGIISGYGLLLSYDISPFIFVLSDKAILVAFLAATLLSYVCLFCHFLLFLPFVATTLLNSCSSFNRIF